MHLFLPAAVLTASEIVEKVRRGDGHEAYTVFELKTDANGLVLMKMIRIVRIVVPLNESLQTE